MDKLAEDLAVLHRIELAREPDFMVGRLRVRPSLCEVEGEGDRRMLQRRVMQVLVALARSPDEVVSQRELILRCWGGLSVSDDAIGRCIGQLRRLAESWAEPPFDIQTIPGVGYRLERKPGPTSPDPSTPTRLTAAPRPPHLRLAVVAAALVLAVALVAAASFSLWSILAPPAATRVAVLPFEALSGGEPARSLGARISDEVLNVLSVNEVEATPPADAQALRGAGLAQAASRLRVGLLLNGTIAEEAGETRVKVRLEDARTHVFVWSAEFRRKTGDDADLDTEVAARVADIIQIAQFARTGPHPLQGDAGLSDLLQAHDLIRWEKKATWARLVELARRVVTDAPDFAFGHSLLAVADAVAVAWGAPPDQSPVLLAAARREAERALMLDPRDEGGYYALSLVEPSYRRREAVLLKGVAANGHPAAPLGAVYNGEGFLLMSVGRLREALPYMERSVAMDPLGGAKTAALIEAYRMTGRVEDARQLLAESLRRWPNYPDIRQVHWIFLMTDGEDAKALAVLADPSHLPPTISPVGAAATSAFIRAKRSPSPNASRAAAGLVAEAADAGGLDREMAVLMLAQLGDLDRAFAQATRLSEAPGGVPIFLFNKTVEPMWRDPRFKPLAARFGLLDYWRDTGKWPDFCAGAKPAVDCHVLLSAGAKAGAPAAR